MSQSARESKTPKASTTTKNALKDASQAQSTNSGKSAKKKSFRSFTMTTNQKVYVPKTPRDSETPGGTNSNSDTGDDPEAFSSPAVFKMTNLTALRKPKPKKQMGSPARLTRIYTPKNNKSVDFSKEEFKNENQDDEEPEIKERATMSYTIGRVEEKEDEDKNSPERHSLPAYITCPTEIGGREITESPEKYELKEETVEDENDVIRLDDQKGITSHIEKPEVQTQGEENIIVSPLNIPAHKEDQEHDEVKEAEDEEAESQGEDNIENVTAEETVKQEEGAQQEERYNTIEEEHLNTISEEKEVHEEEDEQISRKKESMSSEPQDTVSHSDETSVRNIGISDSTSKTDTMAATNDTSISKNEESSRERNDSLGFELQVERKQDESPKKRANVVKREENEENVEVKETGIQENNYRQRESKEIEVRRNVEEAAPKKRGNIFIRPESEELRARIESPDHTKQSETEKKEGIVESNGKSHDTPFLNENQKLTHDSNHIDKTQPVDMQIKNLEITDEKEIQRQTEQKIFAQNLAQKLEKVQNKEITGEDAKRAKGREGCCQGGCNSF